MLRTILSYTLLVGVLTCCMVNIPPYLSQAAASNETGIEEDNNMQTPKMNRLPPPHIEPLTIEGTNYYLDNVRDQALTSSTTYLIAADANFEEKWRTPIYVVKFDKQLETDVQEVFPVSLNYNRDNHSFVIENERGEIFTFNLASKEVKKANLPNS